MRTVQSIAVLISISLAPSLSAQRASPAAPPTPPAARAAARSVTTPVPAALFKDLRYRMIGPARGGRVTTVTGVPREPHTFYMGSTGGGVWKTTDAGQNWTNVSDGFFKVGSMGAVEDAASDPNIVYAGTGSDGLRSNVSIGKGVYKSADAGKTWTHVGLATVGNIGGVRIHPTNPERVFVAAIGNPFAPNADRGVYRTTDGGKNWKQVLFVSDSTGAVDVEFQPGNPNVVFASMWRVERKPWTIISGAREGGVYRSTDGGDTWTKLTNGLPNELVGKSNIAVTPANPNRIYVLMEAKPGNGLYRSDNGGESFTLVSDFAQIITRPFYYTTITADPRSADVVYAGAEGYYKSTDGGRSWNAMRVPHGDNHDMWINPNDSDIMIQSNDGGVNVSLNGGRTWSTQYNQPTAEIYQIIADNQFPYRVYGAQQDNSTLIVPSLPLTSGRPDDPMQEWRTGPGCETGPIMPHPTNPDTVYGSCKGQFSRMSLRTGQEKQYWVGAQSLYGNPGKDLIYRFQRVSPFEISPHDPRTIYYGSQFVHRTRDEGATWEKISPDLTANDPKYQQKGGGEPITIDVTGEEYYSVIYAIREATTEPGVIWTGANDGPFYVTRDDGKTWSKITPAAQPPGCRVQNIEPSPHRKGSAYYAVLCYLLGDFKPYIWRTDDYGKQWTLLTDGTNGIPADEPTRVVREDPDREGLLYAGTEFGMFISFDNGKRWQPFQQNLPATPVTDIRVHHKDLILSTQGRAFWIMHDIAPLHEISDPVANAPAHLFKPRETYRFRYSSAFGGVESNRANPADPQYPPPGAAIDYWLASAPNGGVTLDILDAGGAVLRTFSSEAPPAAEGGGRGGRGGGGGSRVSKAPGLNRFTWDLTLAGPSGGGGGGRGGGPTIVPGAYSVRLTAGDSKGTQPLVVKLDPRMAKDGLTLADLREQLQHNLRARDLVTEVNQLVSRVDAARDRLAKAGGAAADTLSKVEALRAKLVTPAVRYSKPELQAHILYLYSMTATADQKIGRDAIARFAVLRKELDAAIAEANRILGARAAAME
jgi:photosystem II stability/assembly factor-like uncharacterized protein